MQKNLIILGNKDFAQLWAYYVKEYFSSYRLSAFSVDRDYISECTLDGIPVIPFEELRETCPPSEYDVLAAIGYKQMNEMRKAKIQACKAMGYFLPNFIHPTAWVDKDVRMGQGNLILERAVLAHGTILGDGNIIWNSANLSHESILGDYNYLSAGVILAGKTDIGSNCFFGIGSSVRGKRRIADYTVVGAGAFLNESSEPYSIFLPARSTQLTDRLSTDLPFQK